MSGASLTLKRFLFKTYLNLPGNRLVYRFLRRFYIPPPKVRRYLRFKGKYKLVIDENHTLEIVNYGNTIENELFWLGLKGWESYETDAWKELCKHSEVIFDVGANTGLYSLIASKINIDASIYAFEPVDIMLSRLNKNLMINGSNVQVEKMALADEDGTGKIFVGRTVSGTYDQASLSDRKFKNTPDDYLIIKKKRLDSFIAEHRIHKVDLMKIDVETFEPHVLRGMGIYLKDFAPTLLIEILNDQVATEVEQLISEIPYERYRIDNRKGYTPVTSLKPEKRGNNFLLLNRRKHGTISLEKNQHVI